MEERPRGRGWNVMPENAYESLVRRTYQDFESGDLDLLGVVMAQEVVWHEPGRSSLAGHYKGPEEVLGFLGELKARTSGTFKIEVLDVLSEPERAVVFQRETAMKNEKTLDVIAAVDFEIHNGKITEVTVYQNDAYAFDEFWTDDSGQEDNMDDIESELECSTREAGVGSLP
jgi:ketosteroid isomerase-like protein